jgi:hypothetical protein
MNFNDLILLLDNRLDTIKHLASMEVPFKIDEYGNEYYKTKDGERIESPNGTKYWYVNGKQHRLDGPAVEWADGSKSWWVNDELHRLDGPAVEGADGLKAWHINGKLHRTDGPAVEGADGTKEWFIKGVKMTEEEFNKWRAKNNPIKESRSENLKHLASMEFPYEIDEYGNEQYKTKDGYRVEYVNGSKYWYNDEHQLHRLDGPAVERAGGSKAWYVNNKRHRLDGPAIERADGSKAWHINGKLHRTDGPAVEYADGKKQWFVNNKQMTEEEFNKWRAKNNPIK